MPSSVSFHQGCPVCGRTLRIGIHLLGSRVYCQHCGGGFRASDPALASACPESIERPQAERVEELLERAEHMLARRRPHRDHDFAGSESSSPASSESRCQ